MSSSLLADEECKVRAVLCQEVEEHYRQGNAKHGTNWKSKLS